MDNQSQDTQCVGRIWRGYRYYRCNRKGKFITPDGHHWCKSHCPAEVEIKKQQAHDKWERENELFQHKIAARQACRFVPIAILKQLDVNDLLAWAVDKGFNINYPE